MITDKYEIEDILNAHGHSADLQDHGAYRPVEDSLRAIQQGDTLILGWLEPDEDPMDYWDDEGAGELLLKRSLAYRNYAARITDLIAAKTVFFFVDCYDHGNVHYFVGNHQLYSGIGFDVAHRVGVFIPCEAVQAAYHKAKYRRSGKLAAIKQALDDSNRVLREYSRWCNGEVYGWTVQPFDLTTGLPGDRDSCWGYIGYEYALKELEGEVQGAAAR